jgi:DNA-binding NarL/FixJ family response regulator
VLRTVLIVDDHPAFRSAARTLLEDAGFEVVGESADGAAAITAACELRPDIVLLDIQLPDLDGFEVAHRLAEQGVPAAIVLTSSRSVATYRRRLAAHPSWPFVAKRDLSGATLSAAAAG